VKALLDFENLSDDERVKESLDNMIRSAKKAKGFFFFTVNVDDTVGLLTAALSIMDLAEMVTKLDEEYPRIREAQKMLGLFKMLGGMNP